MTTVAGPLECGMCSPLMLLPCVDLSASQYLRLELVGSYNVCNAHHLFFVNKELLWNVGRAFTSSCVTHHRLTHVYTGREFCRFRSRMLSTTTARKNLSLV